ncbi:MAG TPA: thioredoxin domain-containing protein [Candidatus Obscuribacterales bacterium]
MPNRLAQAQSLYLRKHAHNPVDWWPWCDEALETAQRDHKPIFLSIGYSSCHWCTVMEGEAFSDEAIAAYLNTHFLPIKVDREERPDIDSIYMQALQMMIGQGGWPLNIFLAPDDLLPFYGGTYFPAVPKYGRPGFLQVLQALRQYFDTEADRLAVVKAEILDHLQQAVTLPSGDDLSQSVLERGLELSARILAPADYGNSFPMMPYAIAALQGVRFALDPETAPDRATLCRQRGLDLALGGIFDQVAGGFHRYTVDPTWTVPHFEKMLYDNGQIMEYLAQLWSDGWQEPALERAIALTVQWLQREMTAPAGYFYAAQDADSFATATAIEPTEGAFYCWAYDELQQVLGADAVQALATQFTVTAAGNFEGNVVLQRRHPGPLDAATEAALAQLFAVRYGQSPTATTTVPPARDNDTAKTYPWPGRIPPVTDTKMIVAWNSLMISGLARAAAALGRPAYGDRAATAAQFILTHQWVDGRMQRLNYDGQPTVPAQAEDYALFIKALLDLHQAAGVATAIAATPWLDHAVAVQAEFDQWLWNADGGGYYNTAAAASDRLLVRERPYQDNATPAANGVAIANLVRLALLTADLRYLDRAEQGLHAFGAVMAQTPRACPSLFTALDWFRHATLVKTQPERLATLLAAYHPTAVFQADPTLPADTAGLVCEGLFCKAPATDEAMLQAQLRASQRRSG